MAQITDSSPAWKPFDADNHYYEALDAFTRHLPAGWGPRTVQWTTINGRRYHVVGGQINHFVTNPTFDPIAKPGALCKYFRGNPEQRDAREYLSEREPIPAHYRDPAARIKIVEEQGLEGIWLFPTLGVLYEEPLKHDTEAVKVAFTAFNQWIDDEWGFNYRDRIFAAPYITLADVDWACEQLEWAIDRGARMFAMRPAPVWSYGGIVRPPAHPDFDRFWARVAEAGITTIVHAGDHGYSSQGYALDGFSATFNARPQPIRALIQERPIMDFLASLVLDGLFERFPRLRVASIENGSGFLPELFRVFKKIVRQNPRLFKEDPAEVFRRHIWINPFFEDEVDVVMEHMGADRVIFGSDWPHVEGMPQPRDYELEITHYDAPTQRKIMRDNAVFLNTVLAA